MIRMISTSGLTPEDKFNYISAANFDDEGSNETTQALLENEGEKVGDLVSILKDEALEDNTAINEIAAATDVDAKIIKDAADTKVETDAEGDQAGLSDEEKQEYFSQVWRERMWTSIADTVDKWESNGYSGFLAMFSEETISGDESDSNKDTVEAIKIVKYVDDAAIAEEGADEIADIIAEATDGDKDVIKEVVEVKADAQNETAEAVAAYFSEVIGELAVKAGVEEGAAVQQAIAALEEAGEEEARRIEAGENFLKTALVHDQDEGETALTNNDPNNMFKFPSEIADRINSQVAQSYQISNTPDSTQLPNIAPGQNFSYAALGYNPDINANFSNIRPGAPETVLPSLAMANFSDTDDNAIESVKSFLNTAAMVKDMR